MFRNGAANWNFPVREVGSVAELEALSAEEAGQIAAVVIEPMVQGAAGIKLWPPGALSAVRNWCDRSSALLIADEVLTGFGRTGKMFACQHESVMPDMMVLAKGLTGGYLPLAITLITETIFSTFSNLAGTENTLYYGHSYTGNALACAAARASLEIFDRDHVLDDLAAKIETLRTELASLRDLPSVAEVRQCGFIAGVEVRAGPETAGKLGAAICLAARQRGLLTRPIRNVIVLMPPYCITHSQLGQAVRAIGAAIAEVCQERVPA
jgi:adenosylmethionine-8-amino-7-oxononanoate aminotransferase